MLQLVGLAVLLAACARDDGGLRVTGDRLFVPATINGVSTEALLDSGAEMTLVDTAFAAQLGLGASGSETARGTGGEQEVNFAEGVDISAAAVLLGDRRVAILDLTGISQRLVGEPVHVILGRELFDAGRFYLDIEGGVFRRADDAAPAGTRLPLAEHRGIMQLPVDIGGAGAAMADFDLGNGSEVLIGREFAAKHGLLAPERIVGTKPGGGIGGALTRELIRLDSLGVAGVSFPDVIAAIDSTDTASDANLGVAILRSFRMTIDFPEKSVWLAMPDPRDQVRVSPKASRPQAKCAPCAFTYRA